MDNTEVHNKVILTKRKRNRDGSITVTSRPKTILKVKKIIAHGKGEHTVGAVIASQLLPFRKTMRQQLRSNGYDVQRVNLKTLIPLYYNE